MARPVLQRCLTPKAEIPPGLRFWTGLLTWVLVLGLWALACYGGLASPLFLPAATMGIAAATRPDSLGSISFQH